MHETVNERGKSACPLPGRRPPLVACGLGQSIDMTVLIYLSGIPTQGVHRQGSLSSRYRLTQVASRAAAAAQRCTVRKTPGASVCAVPSALKLWAAMQGCQGELHSASPAYCADRPSPVERRADVAAHHATLVADSHLAAHKAPADAPVRMPHTIGCWPEQILQKATCSGLRSA